MTRAPLFSSLVFGLALAIALPAASSFAQVMTPEEIAAKLAIKPKTRTLGVVKKSLDPALAEELNGLLSRKIGVAERVKIEEIKVKADLPTLDFSISFGYDSADISASSYPTLDALATAMKSQDLYTLRFLVNGHTDAKGTDSYNLSLSERRANAVVLYLVNSHGVEVSRLKPIGFGETQLKEESDGESSANRRVEIVSIPTG